MAWRYHRDAYAQMVDPHGQPWDIYDHSGYQVYNGWTPRESYGDPPEYVRNYSQRFPYIVQPRDMVRQAVVRIPTEIWLYIFELSLGSRQGEGYDRFRPSSVSTPVKITHVCRGFRRLAQGAFGLWSTICISPNSRGYFPNRKAVMHFLKYAGSLPLTIILYPDEHNRFEGSNASKVWLSFHATLLSVRNWENLILWGPWGSKIPIPEFMNAPPTRLKSFILDGPVDVEEVHPLVTELVKRTKSLTTFKWRDKIGMERRHTPGFLQKLPLPDMLTHLDLMNSIDVLEFLQLLSHFRHLEECTVQNLYLPPTDHRQPSSPVHMYNLQSLRVMVDLDYFTERTSRGSVLGAALVCIIAPKLQKLSLGYDESWSQPYFEAFLQNSRCQLKTLAFDIVSLTEQDLQRTLQFMTSTTLLQELTVNTGTEARTPVTTTIIHSLTPNPSFYLCPALSCITVNGRTLKYSKGAFAQMIHRRMSLLPQMIRQVHLSAPVHESRLPDVNMLRQLRGAGLYLIVDRD